MTQHDLYTLPENLPAPEDDGAADHLPGTRLPAIALPATRDTSVDLSKLRGRVVVYCYPRTGRPDRPRFFDGWDLIPGARGCTPQACAFRDHHQEISELNTAVFGLSTQSTDDQIELVERLHLPFPVLSDANLEFARALGLPTFTVASTVLLKRLTFIASDAVIEKAFYPVFPPDRNAVEVAAWLQAVTA